MKNREFNLFGTIWKIQFVDQVVNDNDKWVYGSIEEPAHLISISTKDTNGKKLPKYEVELSLLHEVVHAILQTGQYLSCSDDEPLVEWTARCLKSLKEQSII